MKNRLWTGLIVLLWVIGTGFIVNAQSDDDPVDPESPYVGSPDLAAPEFPEDLDWVNVPAPLTMEALRGKILIFDFWTYGCINCIHMIPVLKRLEEKYADELVVIGVHSAKFDNESETQNIAQVVQRYDVQHPVINDKNFIVWRTYGIRAWPSFMVVDPRGNVLALQSGEIPFEAFDELLSGMVSYWDSVGEINREPIALAVEGATTPPSLLAFPGKVMVDVPGSRLFIADSSHHRIIIADLATYEVQTVIGSGYPGYDDGPIENTTFNTPQGMALRDEKLYVADTNNHAIRVIDLDAATVSTLAGNGEMARGMRSFSFQVTAPLEFSLRSPWDVEFGEGDTLYIAMAGTHQIWEMDLETNLLRASVGSGSEAMYNATRANSALAQPSGLYFEDGLLYFADSESSTVRVADTINDTVSTVSGTTDDNLFDFGDVDGGYGESRLQHALGVTDGPDDSIFIADTYNSKIKRLLPDGETVTAFGLGGNGGYVDGGVDVAEFDEPGGLDYAVLADGRMVLFVADTNNHVIRLIDLESETVSTVNFPNPQVLQIEERITVIGGNTGSDSHMVLPPQTVTPGDGEIVFRVILPDGYKLNDDAPSTFMWSTSDAAILLENSGETLSLDATENRVPVTLAAGEATLQGVLAVYYCEAVNETLCFIEDFTVEAPVTVAQDADGAEILIEREIIPPVVADVGGIN